MNHNIQSWNVIKYFLVWMTSYNLILSLMGYAVFDWFGIFFMCTFLLFALEIIAEKKQNKALLLLIHGKQEEETPITAEPIMTRAEYIKAMEDKGFTFAEEDKPKGEKE